MNKNSRRYDINLSIDVPDVIPAERIPKLVQTLLESGLDREIDDSPMPDREDPLCRIGLPRAEEVEVRDSRRNDASQEQKLGVPPAVLMEVESDQLGTHRIDIARAIRAMTMADLVALVHADGLSCNESESLLTDTSPDRVLTQAPKLEEAIRHQAVVHARVDMDTLAEHLRTTGRIDDIPDDEARDILDEHLERRDSALLAEQPADTAPSP